MDTKPTPKIADHIIRASQIRKLAETMGSEVGLQIQPAINLSKQLTCTISSLDKITKEMSKSNAKEKNELKKIMDQLLVTITTSEKTRLDAINNAKEIFEKEYDKLIEKFNKEDRTEHEKSAKDLNGGLDSRKQAILKFVDRGIEDDNYLRKATEDYIKKYLSNKDMVSECLTVFFESMLKKLK